MCNHRTDMGRAWCRRVRRIRRYTAAFALQLYLGAMFSAFAVIRVFERGEFIGGALWPAAYTLVAAVLLAGILRPFSKRLAAAGGALVAVVSAARIGGILELVARHGLDNLRADSVVAVLLWGLVVVVGLRWPRVAYDSGVRHLLDVSQDAPPAPALQPLSEGS